MFFSSFLYEKNVFIHKYIYIYRNFFFKREFYLYFSMVLLNMNIHMEKAGMIITKKTWLNGKICWNFTNLKKIYSWMYVCEGGGWCILPCPNDLFLSDFLLYNRGYCIAVLGTFQYNITYCTDISYSDWSHKERDVQYSCCDISLRFSISYIRQF